MDQAQDGERHGRFAGARFTGQAEALARAQAERHIVHRAHQAERMVVADAQVLDAQHRGVHADCRRRGIGDFVEPDGEEEQAEEHHDDDDDRRDPPPPPAVEDGGVEVDPVERHAERRRFQRAEAEHFQADRGKDRGGYRVDQRGGEIGQQVRHHLAQDDLRAGHAVEPRHLDIAAFAQREHLGADGACRIEPGERGDDDRHLVDGQAAAHRHGDDDQHQKAGHGQADVGDAADHGVDHAAIVAGDEARARCRCRRRGSRR